MEIGFNERIKNKLRKKFSYDDNRYVKNNYLFPSHAYANQNFNTQNENENWIVNVKGWSFLQKQRSNYHWLTNVSQYMFNKNNQYEVGKEQTDECLSYFLDLKNNKNIPIKVEYLELLTQNEVCEMLKQRINKKNTNNNNHMNLKKSYTENDMVNYDNSKIKMNILKYEYENSINNSGGVKEKINVNGYNSMNEYNKMNKYNYGNKTINEYNYGNKTINKYNYGNKTINENNSKSEYNNNSIYEENKTNEYNNVLNVNSNKYEITLMTSKTGHFDGQLSLLLNTKKLNPPNLEIGSKFHNYIKIKAENTVGIVELISKLGLSVISDIDDTIRETCCTKGKKAIIMSTFIKEWDVVKGMPEIYLNWYLKGLSFHYVSASPWQLYPMLDNFLQVNNFPPGSFHLKLFSMSQKSKIFQSPQQTKIVEIKEILNAYPQRKFILIGDSGQLVNIQKNKKY